MNDDIIVIYDMVKNLIRKYTEERDSQQKLLDIYKEKYKDVAESMEIEIESCNRFIEDLKEIKNKIIELNNNA